LANATLPYMVKIAERGWRQAARCDRSLALGINAVDGMLTSAPVAEAHGLPVMDVDEVITGD
jgi:alanine dehydrogenase